MTAGKLAASVAAKSTTDAPNGLRTAVVAAINAAGTGIRVTINGATAPDVAGQYITCVSSYDPRVGDTVALFRQDSTWLALGATSRADSVSRYTGGATSLAANAWTVLPFSTLAEGPTVPNNGSGVFTLPRGVWAVEFTAITGTATGHVASIFGLFRDATTTSGTTYGEGLSGVAVSQSAGSITRTVTSDGSATVCAAIFPSSTNAPLITVLNQLPALVLRPS